MRSTIQQSKTLYSTFGHYKSLDYMDCLIDENGIDRHELSRIRRILSDVNELYSHTNKIENVEFKKYVRMLVRGRLLLRIRNTDYKDSRFPTILRNFIISKFRDDEKNRK